MGDHLPFNFKIDCLTKMQLKSQRPGTFPEDMLGSTSFLIGASSIPSCPPCSVITRLCRAKEATMEATTHSLGSWPRCAPCKVPCWLLTPWLCVCVCVCVYNHNWQWLDQFFSAGFEPEWNQGFNFLLDGEEGWPTNLDCGGLPMFHKIEANVSHVGPLHFAKWPHGPLLFLVF